MRGVLLTPLRQIDTLGGAVFHGLRSTDPGFAGFGEAYFSCVDKGAVKGWKRHRRMVMNLIVPVGQVRFVVHDEAAAASEDYASFDLSADGVGYARLTVQPGLWIAFTGVSEAQNMILNLASILHDPEEADKRDVDPSAWRWS